MAEETKMIRLTEREARRIHAAIALGGMKGVPDLAKKLGPGWGQDTIYARLSGEKQIPDYIVKRIADLCGVPYEWIFVEDPFAAMHVAEHTAALRKALQDLSPLLLAAAEQDAQDQLDQQRGADSGLPDAEDDDEDQETGQP